MSPYDAVQQDDEYFDPSRKKRKHAYYLMAVVCLYLTQNITAEEHFTSTIDSCVKVKDSAIELEESWK